jgi:hypothetical protein
MEVEVRGAWLIAWAAADAEQLALLLTADDAEETGRRLREGARVSQHGVATRAIARFAIHRPVAPDAPLELRFIFDDSTSEAFSISRDVLANLSRAFANAAGS